MPFYDYGETPTKACLCWQHKWQGSLFSTAHCWRDWLVPERAALRRTKQLAPWDLNRKGGKKTVQVDLQLRKTCLNRKWFPTCSTYNVLPVITHCAVIDGNIFLSFQLLYETLQLKSEQLKSFHVQQSLLIPLWFPAALHMYTERGNSEFDTWPNFPLNLIKL